MHGQAALTPELAITLYRSSLKDSTNLIALLHELGFDGENIVMGVGRPVNAVELKELLLGVINDRLDDTEAGFVPENMFYRNGALVGWIRPAGKAYISLKNRVIHAPLPPLAFLCDGENMKVCALKPKDKPQANTPIYHAPILNVYADGRICWGTVKKPRTPADKIMDSAQEWEKALIESVGTHINHPNTLKLSGKEKVETIDYVRFMGELESKKQFPQRNLAPMNMTLGEFIKSF